MANIPKVWNGTQFVELEAAATVAPAASTTVVGIVQLTDSTSSTSTTTAATPNSVKSAYDLAGTAIPKDTVTAEGDILYASGSATVARLAIGTADQVLGIAAGVPAWTTPAAGAVTLISSTTLGTATQTVTLSSIPGTYKRIELYVSGLKSSTASASDLKIRFNNAAGGIYGSQRVSGISSTASAGRLTGQTSIAVSTTSILSGGTVNSRSFFTLQLFDYAVTTTGKSGLMTAGAGTDSNAMLLTQLYSVMTSGTAAISSIEVFSTSETALIDSGARFDLYGVS